MSYPKISESKYQELAIELALSEVTINECQKCWHPYLDRYCCRNCGDSRPDMTYAEEKAWTKKYRTDNPKILTK